MIGAELSRVAPETVRAFAPAERLPDGAVWISWERHRRTRELSRSLHAELVELTSRSRWLVRYPILLWRTVWRLARRRPSVLLVQCPSVLLGVWVSLLKHAFGYRLVADLHNEAVVPFNYSGRVYLAALRFIHRTADVSVVSNDALKRVVEQHGGRAFALPDRIPGLAVRPHALENAARPAVVFVCTYAPDEPFLEVIDAARLIGPSIDLYVTGNPRRMKRAMAVPSHVHLTGFLSESAYGQLLARADVIVDLTMMDDCLVCGAYEAVALAKPLVTSDTPALRQYFRNGTVYSAHDPVSLAAAITRALGMRRQLAGEMAALRRDLRAEWTTRRDALCALLKQEVH